MKFFNRSIIATTSLALLAFPVSADEHKHDHNAHGDAHGEHQAFGSVNTLIAAVCPTEANQAMGEVEFIKLDDGKVMIKAKFSGLKPNSKHAIHIHEFGDIRDLQGKAAGGHYNPEGHDHGLPSEEKRHAGDLGNLKADENGVASMELTVDNISLVGPKNPIVGRSIIVHEGADDGGQPTGNAGPRIAQGVIGIAKNK